MSKVEVSLMVNREHASAIVAPDITLLTVLRDQLALTGAKRGCNQGVCGACTVLKDGIPVRSCLTLAITCNEAEITTVEGLADGERLAPLQQAFIQTGAAQCGFCTSGMLLIAHAFLKRCPHPSLEETRTGISGNLCRCTGYRKIVDAVQLAAGGRN